MAKPDFWSDLFQRQAGAPPLEFVNGFFHVVPHDFYCSFHNHPYLEIVYHPSGRGVTKVDGGREIPFREGDVVIYPAGQVHDQTMSQSGEDWCLQIAVPMRAKDQAHAVHIPAIQSQALVEDIRSLTRGSAKWTASQRTIFNMRGTVVLVELLHLITNRRAAGELSAAERYVLEAERLMAEKFSEIDSLRQIADGVGIGYDHLRHLFKTHRKKNMLHHLNEVRIERARTLLTYSQLPLKQVASMCGFKDEYYFSTVFRNFTGTAPGRYRERRDGGRE